MEERGPFDRVLQPEPVQQRDRTAVAIVAAAVFLGLLLLVLVLPPISIFEDDDEQPSVTGPVTAKMRDELPPLPTGFEAVSALFDLESREPVRQSARLTVNLSTSVPQSEDLFLFSYVNGRWRQLGRASAVADGNAARGDVPFLPSNIAVFRRAETSRLIVGSLPAGGELDPRALDALTALNPGGLSPAADGSISGDLPELPSDLQVAVAPAISALEQSQIDDLNDILASEDLRGAHVQAIVDLVRENNFAGIDLDYRSIDPARAEDFVAFVSALSAALQAEQKMLTLTLPAPVRRTEGWDTLGFDWQALAPLADAVKLALEPEQDRYFQRMEEALAYLVSRVGSSKLLLTIGSLSRERGVDGVRTLTLTEALTLASVPTADPDGPVSPGATVQALGQNLAGQAGGLLWDDTARAVVFRYTGPGGERTVWLANVFSEAFKLDLARRYQLGGVAIEDVSRRTEDANIWSAVLEYGQTGNVTLVKPNGQLLQPRWTADGGVLQDDGGASVTWRAPDETGTYTLTLIVSDGVIRVGQRIAVAVEASASGRTAP